VKSLQVVGVPLSEVQGANTGIWPMRVLPQKMESWDLLQAGPLIKWPSTSHPPS
jgi:hypothetical protein